MSVNVQWKVSVEKNETIRTLEEIRALWEEYSYRHSLIWRVVFQTTAAVVALSIVPYLESAKNAGYLRIFPLIIAIGVAWFAKIRIEREFNIFDPVKTKYLSSTRNPAPDGTQSKFKFHTMIYLNFLFWLSVGHLLILIVARLIPWLYCFLNLRVAA